MTLSSCPTTYYTPAYSQFYYSVTRRDILPRFNESISITVTELKNIIVGKTRYDLKNSIIGSYHYSPDKSNWSFWVERFSPEFIGEGIDMNGAKEAFDNIVHATFQRLYIKRSFQMNEDEYRKWLVIQDNIDVASYINETALEFREIGRVTGNRPGYPNEITWIDGRKEKFDLIQTDRKLAGYSLGQWFDATVYREPRSLNLISINNCQRISAIQGLNNEDLKKYWESLKTTNSLP